MKKTLLGLVLALTFSVGTTAVEAPAAASLQPLPAQTQAAAMTAEFLSRAHYQAQPLDDAMSQKIFDRYLKSLDSERLFFVQSDIDQFSQARDKLDDALKNRNLGIPFAIFNQYQRRLRERLAFARGLLDQTFDFTLQEDYNFVREHAPWAANEAELNDLWRRRVKNEWLRLRLANKDDAAIRTTLKKRYDYAISSNQKIKTEDVFQIFMNAYALSLDPHTNYLGIRATEDFDISMKLALVGIGAVLQLQDETTTIRELVPGGPAAGSGQLKVGDRIVAVGQGAQATPTDVLGWRLDDVVALIRGAEDSVVRLEIAREDAGPDAPHQMVNLVRKKISLDRQAAKKSIQEVKMGGVTRRIGVVALPAFYQDFEGRQKGVENFRSATRDVKRILQEFKLEKVDSVLVDLRNNGGGALTEAVELSSLFLGDGPVVQQRDAQGRVQVNGNNKVAPVWEGPMGVLINHSSASASEIFAAAIQDYGRGIIFGEPSFGKGTVQTVINYDGLAHSEKPTLGSLKMTIAQFYRVNGGTTQLRGVTPDIAFPAFLDEKRFGESSFDNALPWGQIANASYQPEGDLKEILPLLQAKHLKRIAEDEEFKLLRADIDEFMVQKDRQSISLNEAARRAERDTREAREKAKKAIRDKLQVATSTTNKSAKPGSSKETAEPAAQPTADDGLQANERSLKSQLDAEKAGKEAKDILLVEAAHILGDELSLIESSAVLARQVMAKFARTAPIVTKVSP